MRTRLALKRVVVVTAAIAMLCASRTAAQDTQQEGVLDFVERFLLHLGDHEFDKVAADLAPQSIIIVARERDGAWSNTYQSGDQWVRALKRSSTPATFSEPLTNVTVSVDNDRLAFVRADFQVMRGGAAQSFGVDLFTLTREGGAWKIAAVAYTSRQAQ